MRWHELLAGLDVAERAHDADVEVTFITEDSRRVVPGTCFACRTGTSTDGHDHAEEAMAHGAVALLVERVLPLAVPQARVASLARTLGPAAARLYHDPSRSLRCIGITGTAGKSTTAALSASIARAAGDHVGLIGNDGVFVDGAATDMEKWGGTNVPQADQLQHIFAVLRDRGVRTVAMEVTSRAVESNRIDATWFEAGCFTNLSHEHLDDHGTMEGYFRTKLGLFDPSRVATVVTNVDDPYGVRVREHAARRRLEAWTYGVLDDRADIGAADVELGPRGASFMLLDRRIGDRVPVVSHLLGAFNVHNVLAAAACARAVGIGLDAVVQGVDALTGVAGRAEAIDAGQPFTVLVDYAHSPGELEAVLAAARGLARERVVVAFGCGGDRDPSKRPLMGEAAGNAADLVVVTTDNPRSEDPGAIADAVMLGLAGTAATVMVELDRRAAIREALAAARPGDVVVIAGKGPERGQAVGGRTTPFDDRLVAREELGGLGWR